MKTSLTLLISALCAISSQTAMAQEHNYAGAMIQRVEYKPDGGDGATPTAIAMIIGRQFNPNFAGEIRLGTNLASANVGDTDITVEVSSYFGLYARGLIPVSDTVTFYGLLGYTNGSSRVRLPNGYSESSSDSNVSYGFGADFKLSRSMSAGVEWGNFVRGDGYELSALGLNVKYQF